jgi:hypothetical protein
MRARGDRTGSKKWTVRAGPGLATATGMNTTSFEPLLRDTTIKAIDGVAKKLSAAERTAESKVTKLLTYWNEMEPDEKEHAVGIAIATITTAVTAIIALRSRTKKPGKTAAKKAAKKVVKAVLKKV